MQKTLLLLCLLFISTSAAAETSFLIDGHVFSNVNCLQRGHKTVIVSGRVTGGKIRGPMTIRIHIHDRDGASYSNTAYIENYDGRGELFQTKISPGYRARPWLIQRIEVFGNKPTSLTKNKIYTHQYSSTPQRQNLEHLNFKFYPKKTKSSRKCVHFSSSENVQIIIKEQKSQAIVLIKNIKSHKRGTISIKPGKYTAKIIGKNSTREINFSIKKDGQTIAL